MKTLGYRLFIAAEFLMLSFAQAEMPPNVNQTITNTTLAKAEEIKEAIGNTTLANTVNATTSAVNATLQNTIQQSKQFKDQIRIKASQFSQWAQGKVKEVSSKYPDFCKWAQDKGIILKNNTKHAINVIKDSSITNYQYVQAYLTQHKTEAIIASALATVILTPIVAFKLLQRKEITTHNNKYFRVVEDEVGNIYLYQIE